MRARCATLSRVSTVKHYRLASVQSELSACESLRSLDSVKGVTQKRWRSCKCKSCAILRRTRTHAYLVPALDGIASTIPGWGLICGSWRQTGFNHPRRACKQGRPRWEAMQNRRNTGPPPSAWMQPRPCRRVLASAPSFSHSP